MKNIITVDNISKHFKIGSKNNKWYNFLRPRYETKVAVDNISFALNTGDFTGFLGPNGAGKSTTIKMLTGILTPTAGTITAHGIIPYEQRQAHALNIGVVFGQRTQLWWDLPPKESFKLLAKMYKIPAAQYHKNLTTFSELLGLNEFMHIPVRKLSLGQKMRCELAGALLHDPELLFLDEPTIGLDLFAKEAIRDFLKQINRERNTTILLTTHDLGDVENLCKKIIIIDHGKIIVQDTLDNLKQSLGNQRMIAFEIDPHTEFNLPADCKKIKSLENIHYIAATKQTTPAIVAKVLATNTVHDITFEANDITEVIKRAYNRV